MYACNRFSQIPTPPLFSLHCYAGLSPPRRIVLRFIAENCKISYDPIRMAKHNRNQNNRIYTRECRNPRTRRIVYNNCTNLTGAQPVQLFFGHCTSRPVIHLSICTILYTHVYALLFIRNMRSAESFAIIKSYLL